MGRLIVRVVLVWGLVVCQTAVASIPVSDHITVDTVWENTSEPYVLAEDLHIDSGVTLTLAEGVTLRSGYASVHGNKAYDIYVDGRLEGTNLRIRLYSADVAAATAIISDKYP